MFESRSIQRWLSCLRQSRGCAVLSTGQPLTPCHCWPFKMVTKELHFWITMSEDSVLQFYQLSHVLTGHRGWWLPDWILSSSSSSPSIEVCVHPLASFSCELKMAPYYSRKGFVLWCWNRLAPGVLAPPEPLQMAVWAYGLFFPSKTLPPSLSCHQSTCEHYKNDFLLLRNCFCF